MTDNNPQPFSVISNILQSIIDGTEYTGPADSRIAQLLLALKGVIEAIPKGGLIPRGTLGTGPDDLPDLPDDASLGDTYFVATAGTYDNIEANIGDMFYFNANDEWSYVPTGDVLPWKDINATLASGSTTVTVSDASITANSKIQVFAPVWYSNYVQSAGSVVFTFPSQSSAMDFIVRVS